MDIEKVFTNVVGHEGWLKKCFILSLISCAPVAVMGIAIVLALVLGGVDNAQGVASTLVLVSFIVIPLWLIWFLGYYNSSLHKMIHTGTFQLAAFNEKNLLSLGFKSAVGYLLYGIIFYGVVMLATIAPIFLLIALTSQSESNGLVELLGGVLAFIFILAIALVLGIMMNVSFTSFATTLKFGTIFNLATHFRIIKENLKSTFILIGLMILLNIAIGVVNSILQFTVIGVIAMPFVSAFSIFLMMELEAQYARDINIKSYYGFPEQKPLGVLNARRKIL